ncbi:MAG: ATP-binding protein, partial [Brevinema sp.]
VVGKNPWLKKLQDDICLLRDTLEKLLPTVDLIKNQEQGLAIVNESLGSIDQKENQIESKQETYFIVEQISLGKKYLEMFDQYRQLKDQDKKFKQDQEEYNDKEQLLLKHEDKLFDQEDRIAMLRTEVLDLKEEQESINKDPLSVIGVNTGQNIFNLLLGSMFIAIALFISFTMRTALFNIYKVLALGFFVLGVLTLFITWLKALSIQMLSNKDKKSFVHDYIIAKAQKKFHQKNRELNDLQQEYDNTQKECRDLRKELKTLKFSQDTRTKEAVSFKRFTTEIQELADQIYKQLGTDDPDLVYDKIKELDRKIGSTVVDFDYRELKGIKDEKQDLLEQKNQASKDYQKIKNSVEKQIVPLINNLRSNTNSQAVSHFYPEIDQLTFKNHLTSYEELMNQVDQLCDRINQDVYYADKLVAIHDRFEHTRDHLLYKALNSPFMEHLVQAIFGGKYSYFVAEFDHNEKIRIFTVTGHGERYALESLSSATIAQFWFMLRLVVAKTILGKQTGVILLDDPFISFDTLRKKSFLELLNAFAHQGWQIVCTITDDQVLLQQFIDLYGSDMKLIDLNKDFD